MSFFLGDRHADAVAVLSPGTALETTAVQLDPSCSYKLEYVTADYEDVKQKVYAPKNIPISLELSNVEMLAQHDLVNVVKKSSNPRIHYHFVHFRPKKATMPMVFTCDGSQDRKCILTFVKIEPLFVKHD